MRRLLLLLSLALLALPGCTLRGSGADDDDDDDSAVDDDDDATFDDDDVTGDDDDATGDDDDATGDDDDSTLTEGSSTLGGLWTVSYWSDAASSVPVCQQAYLFDGLSETRANVLGNSCPACTAKIDVTNVINVTANGPGAGHPLESAYTNVVSLPCTSNHFPTQTDYGSLLSSTTMVPGGDWLFTQGLIDAGSGVAANMGVATIGNMDSFASLRGDYAAQGVTLTHIGYVSDANAGALTQLGLNTVAVEAGSGTGWWPFWIYWTASGATDGRFVGAYGIGSPWLLTQNGAGVDYETITFGGTLIGQ